MKNEQQNKLLWKKKHYKYRNRHKKNIDIFKLCVGFYVGLYYALIGKKTA
jgi:hypothetical protein